MPELPELEALRIRIAPRVEGKLITAATVNPKKAHLLRYPVDNFALELPARRIDSLTRRGKHLVFATELGGGGSPRWLVINPMLGGRFQVASAEEAVPATEVFTIRVEGKVELRYLDFRDMGRIYWVEDCAREVPAWEGQGPEANSVASMGLDVFRKRLRRFRDDPVGGAAAPAAPPCVPQARGGGGAVPRHSHRAVPRGRGDPGQPEVRGVEAGPEIHGGACEGRANVSAMRAPDQPAGHQPRATELLPRLPALISLSPPGERARERGDQRRTSLRRPPSPRPRQVPRNRIQQPLGR
ncbi:MAG: hypothetical protein E6I50_10875, partial [Chloroflexi bacterium]